MKKIFIPIVLIILIFSGSGIYVSYLERGCDEINGFIDSAYACESFSEAEKYINLAGEALEKKSLVLCIFIDQELIGDAEDGIILCRELCRLGEYSQLKSELVMLKEKINHLSQSEKFDLKRIL